MLVPEHAEHCNLSMPLARITGCVWEELLGSLPV